MRSWLRTIINERFVFCLILLNSILLFLNAFTSINDKFNDLIFIADYLISLYFVLEILLKLFLEKWEGFWSKGWNIFDFVIVSLSSPMLFSPLLEVEDLSFLIVFRLFRIFRYFRLLRFIPDQHHIATGIVRSLKASIGVFLIIFLYNFILSLISVYLFREVAPAYFENPFMALYTIFRVFTIEGWYEIPEIIAANSSAGFAVFARIYFVFVVFSGGILGLSLANAVFVDQMMTDNVDKAERQIADLQKNMVSIQKQLDRIEDLSRKN